MVRKTLIAGVVSVVLLITLMYLFHGYHRKLQEGFAGKAEKAEKAGKLPSSPTSKIPADVGGSFSKSPIVSEPQQRDIQATQESVKNFLELSRKTDPNATSLPDDTKQYLLNYIQKVSKFDPRKAKSVSELSQVRRSAEEASKMLRNATVLHSAVTVAKPTGAISLNDLRKLKARIHAEHERLANVRSTSPTMTARMSQLEKIKADVGDILSSVERGQMKEKDIPITEEAAQAFLKNKYEGTLITPSGVSKGRMAGLSKKDTRTTTRDVQKRSPSPTQVTKDKPRLPAQGTTKRSPSPARLAQGTTKRAPSPAQGSMKRSPRPAQGTTKRSPSPAGPARLAQGRTKRSPSSAGPARLSQGSMNRSPSPTQGRTKRSLSPTQGRTKRSPSPSCEIQGITTYDTHSGYGESKEGMDISTLLQNAQQLKWRINLDMEFDPEMKRREQRLEKLESLLSQATVGGMPVSNELLEHYTKEVQSFGNQGKAPQEEGEPQRHYRDRYMPESTTNEDGFPKGEISPDVYVRPGFVMNDSTIANRASSSSFDDSLVGGPDYKPRALELCRQIQNANLGEPLNFGCIPNPDAVSSGYSWKGNYGMVCNRLGDTWGGWYPEMFGCPKYDPTAKFQSNKI